MSKVLLINNCYPTASNPNKSTYIRSIEEALILAGLQVDRLVFNSDYSSNFQKAKNYLIYYKKLLTFSKYHVYDYVYIHHFPFSFFPLLPHLKSFQKLVINWHGEDLLPSSPAKKALCALSYKFLENTYAHIVPSEYFKEVLNEKLKIRDNVFISPSGGVDTDLFFPLKNSIKLEDQGKELLVSSEHKKQLAFSGERGKEGKIINIGFASGITKEKGIEYIIYCINHQKKLPEKVVFHIIDYGNEKEKYREKISRKDNVVLHSIYEKREMPYFYKKIEILAFPTTRKSESLGLVALEAMSCGVPVVGPAHFALKNIIQSGRNGEAYANFTYEDFFEALKKCMANLEHYTSRATILNQYSKEYVINKFKDIFK